jgi:hypothetical protein
MHFLLKVCIRLVRNRTHNHDEQADAVGLADG